jgi:hypothetical protein
VLLEDEWYLQSNRKAARECELPLNGLRYRRWGGNGEAIQPEKG